jgi:hypothetical protein
LNVTPLEPTFLIFHKHGGILHSWSSFAITALIARNAVRHQNKPRYYRSRFFPDSRNRLTCDFCGLRTACVGERKIGSRVSVQRPTKRSTGPVAPQCDPLVTLCFESCRGFLISSSMDPTSLSILLTNERPKGSQRDRSCPPPKFSERRPPKERSTGIA